MPEPSDPLRERFAAAPGLATLLAEAAATWQARSGAAEAADADINAKPTDAAIDAERNDADAHRDRGDSPSADSVHGAGGARRPGWRSFEDAFPTFYQFTNRPR
jgi:hypothetical protein